MTASMRAFSWAKYFAEFDLKPTVVCRNWEDEIGGNIKFTEEKNFDLYQVKCKNLPFSSWKHSENRLKRLLATYSELIFTHNNLFRRDTYPLYKCAQKLILERKYKYLLVVAEPFVLFKYGYKLNREFKISWIADYRDDWTTSVFKPKINQFLKPYLDYSNEHKEKKWIGSATFFTSVSEKYVQNIEQLTMTTGHVAENGYFEEDFASVDGDKLEPFEDFTISLGGTIYDGQDIAVFLRGFNQLIDKYKERLTLKCNLLGPYPFSEEDIPDNAVKELLEHHPDNYELSDRMPRTTVLEILKKSHMLLLVGYTNASGIPSSKLYEYIGLRKPVVLCPTDKDVMENALRATGQLIACANENELVQKLSLCIDEFIEGKGFSININEEIVLGYSRKNRAKQLTSLIKAI